MPIEFRCTQCNKLLRTGDDTAGKQAKCPECGTVMTIPMPDLGAGMPSQSMGSFEAAPSPFAAPSAPMPQDSGNPYQSPTSGGLEQQFAPSGQIRPTRIEFSETFSRTWEIFADKWVPVLVAVIILGVIHIVVSFGVQAVLIAVAMGVKDATVVGVVQFFVQVAHQVFGIWLGIGVQLFLLGVVRGEEPRYGLLFSGGQYLLSVILLTVLVTLIVMLGLVLLIIPGIIFSFMLMQAQLLVVDRKMGVMDAMSTSRDVMVGNKLTVFAIGLVAGMIGLMLVLLTCGLGALAVMPYMMILSIVIYFGVTGQPTMLDDYATSPEHAGGSPFGQPGPGEPSGGSPFSS